MRNLLGPRRPACSGLAPGRRAAPEPLSVGVDRHRGAIVIQLFGELDAGNATILIDALGRARKKAGRWVIVDLSGLDFIDGAGLHALTDGSNRDARLVLLRGPRAVHRAFEISGLDARLPFVD